MIVIRLILALFFTCATVVGVIWTVHEALETPKVLLPIGTALCGFVSYFFINACH